MPRINVTLPTREVVVDYHVDLVFGYVDYINEASVDRVVDLAGEHVELTDEEYEKVFFKCSDHMEDNPTPDQFPQGTQKPAENAQ